MKKSLFLDANDVKMILAEHFGVKPEESYIYEDSEVGLEAAFKSGANVIKVGKF